MASRKVLIVGGVAGGATCAARLRRLDEKGGAMTLEGAALSNDDPVSSRP